MSEPFQWNKFFKGLVDPTAYFKTLAIILRIGIMVLVVVLIFCIGLKIKETFFGKKPTNNVIINGQQGGEVHNTQDDKKQKFGLINLW